MNAHNGTRKRKANRRKRRASVVFRRFRTGSATIETAVFLPVIAFLTFGSIELCNLIFMRQTLQVAAYEAARSATRPGGSEALGTLRAQEVLTSRGVSSYNVQFSPTISTTTPRGTQVRVTVSTGSSSLSYAPFRIFSGSTISSSTTMVRQ